MTYLILDAEKQTALALLNTSGDPTRQLVARTMADGNAALNEDLLTDCGEGQTWSHYAEFLATLWEAEVSEEEFLVS